MSISPDKQTREGAYSLEKEFAASFFNDSLHLILLPTEQCNFRCTYCYEDFSIGRMSSEVSEGVKRLLDRRLDGLQSLSVSWFGGEPLLARDIIEDISAHITHAAAKRPELAYAADITTNGYLLDVPAVERLAQLGVRSYQISLDGPRLLHDSTRLRANGKGSFDQIWGNLLAIRDSGADVNVLLRIHLTPENVSVLPDFLNTIRGCFLSDQRFKVFLKPVERMGGTNDDSINVLPEEDRTGILNALQAIVIGTGDSHKLFASEEVCYAARANSLMIRADGRVGKCTVALTDPVNTVGRLLPDGSLHLDNAILRAWLKGWENGDRSYLGCPYASMPRNTVELLQINAPNRAPRQLLI